MFAQKKEVSKHNFIAIWTIKNGTYQKYVPFLGSTTYAVNTLPMRRISRLMFASEIFA